MDSLTQITLGAAMGELVLGRKIGNRAMVWGAIGGTIPDLDVLSRFWMTEIDALAFHRGLTHSFAFAILVPGLLGWMVWRYYENRYHDHTLARQGRWIAAGVGLLAAVSGVLFLSKPLPDLAWWPAALALTGLTLAGIFRLRRRLLAASQPTLETRFRDWYLLFFWAIFTHPILDAFTAYGTQLFYPFSDYRVAFNVIAIVDPIYTVPFLGALILAGRLSRSSELRRRMVWFGVVWSTVYLLLCTLNKHHVDRIFERSFQEEGLQVNRYTTSPTIFNNLLWQGVVETDSFFYLGTYSLLDREPRVRDFVAYAREEALAAHQWEDPSLRILRWFSNGYYIIRRAGEEEWRFSDLRYGGVLGGDGPSETRFIFHFALEPSVQGWIVRQIQPAARDMQGAFRGLWLRIRGYHPDESDVSPG